MIDDSLAANVAADGPEPAFATIGIVGLGLLGGSIALAVREFLPSTRIVAVDNPSVLDAARASAVIDAGSADLSVLAGADLVILAAPVRQNLELIGRLADHVKATAIVTDVGSTKRDIVQAAGMGSAARLTFVAGHPIAGAAVGGLQNARADLFRNRPWLVTPTPSAPDDAVRRVLQFAAALGSTPTVMTLADHDRVFAFVSHLPQLAVSAMMAVSGDAVGTEGLALAGRGLLDTTRLASSPSDIWRDVALVNADQIGPALDAFIAVLQSLRADLAHGERLAEVFADAARWRDELVSHSTL
ncbi:MAG: prephenate dehydrogenase/arogenate dehydrogenase family protein [Vicinamibacterales bacterium]